MSDSALRTAIKTLLDEVTGIGKVHKYDRRSSEDSKFLALFQDETSKKIFGWEIAKDGFRLEKVSQKYKLTHNFVLKGYYGLQDAAETEITFNAVIDLVILKFVTKKVSGAEGHPVPQAGRTVPKLFGSVLCHTVDINLPVAELIEATEEQGLEDLLKLGIDYYLKPGDDTKDASDTVTLSS